MPSDAGGEVVIFWRRRSLSIQVIPIYQGVMPFMTIRLYKRHDLKFSNTISSVHLNLVFDIKMITLKTITASHNPRRAFKIGAYSSFCFWKYISAEYISIYNFVWPLHEKFYRVGGRLNKLCSTEKGFVFFSPWCPLLGIAQIKFVNNLISQLISKINLIFQLLFIVFCIDKVAVGLRRLQ